MESNSWKAIHGGEAQAQAHAETEEEGEGAGESRMERRRERSVQMRVIQRYARMDQTMSTRGVERRVLKHSGRRL